MAQPKLVVIDDEVEFTKALDAFFAARGFEVIVAMSGSSGLEMVEYHKPDVVLTDLKMPGTDGEQVLRHIVQNNPSTKVIVLTAYNDGGKTKDRLLAHGAFAHFDKPVSSLRHLYATVKEALISS